MSRLSDVCIDRPVFATMLVLALVVTGAIGFAFLPVDRYPAVDLPTVILRTELPGAAPEAVEISVTSPIEEAVNTVAGIDEMRSISGPSTSLVLITFDLDRDIDLAAQDVRDRVSQAMRRLPDDVEAPIVSKFDNDSTPVMTVAISGDRSLRELSEIADKRVKRVLERGRGVGEVRLVGDVKRSINVWLDADRLAAYDLPVEAVQSAIARQNREGPGGNVTTDLTERSLRTVGRLPLPRDFEDLTVVERNGVPIKLRDLGRVEDGTEEVRSTARLDGTPAVVLEVRRQSGANTVAVIDGVSKDLDELRDTLPTDIRVEVVRDQSRYIRAALHEIEFHLVIGSLLAALVVLWFLRSFRAMMIAGVAIPVSVITTFGAMWALGFTLNGVTMLALVLMVGVVIDDAIVILENIQRWADEKNVTPFAAARGAVKEIALAVMATTLSLVVIFVPVSFMSSISGRFLYQFGITAAISVMVSLLVSFSLTPSMCARLVRPARHAGAHSDPSEQAGIDTAGQSHGVSTHASRGRLERWYMRILERALRHPLLVCMAALAVMASVVPLYRMVPQDYIPSDVDEGEFEIRVSGPDSASVVAMDGVMRRIEDELAAMPVIRSALTTVGGGFLSGVATGSVYVRIAPHEERRFSLGRLWTSTLAGEPMAAFRDNVTQRDIMSDVRKRLRALPDVRASVRNQRSFNIGGGNYDIDFVIRGPDLRALADYTEQLKEKAQQLGGMVDLDTTLRLERPELRVTIDRDRAAELGIEAQSIATTLRLLVGGATEASRYRDASLDEEYDVRLRLREDDRKSLDSIGRLPVARPGGGTVRLDDLVTIDEAVTASRIDRLDRQRQAALRGSLAPGAALADRIDALRVAAEELGMPAQYTTAVSGRARELERAGSEFFVAFLLSLVFMYMVLAAQFESFGQPLIILLALPLAAPFAMLSLWAFGQTLNLYSALGVLVLFGMVKKNAILQVDHTNQLLRAGRPAREAVLQGSRDRLRPILMTTFAFVAGMLPLALGSGPGAEERKAIAVVVIGGQMLCLGFSLVLTPVVQWITLRRRA
ncbi:MAG: efflux RND transporter permease subunit, partial [Planctomycetes bacterium]|nr:efflux RND transporter permease subunit [Planctomycetota bacterium]